MACPPDFKERKLLAVFVLIALVLIVLAVHRELPSFQLFGAKGSLPATEKTIRKEIKNCVDKQR